MLYCATYDFNDDDIDSAFVSAVRTAVTEGNTALCHVLPLSEICGEPDDSGVKCLVIGLPAERRDVAFASDHIFADVRYMADNTYDACLFFANDSIAVSERILSELELGYDDDLTIFWIFRDTEVLWSHRYTDDMRDQLVAASNIAEALNKPPRRKSDVFEFFESAPVAHRTVEIR
ncbi:hypothetical protein [Paraburkholderia caribensis]|uniref:hypothetical protein n=1 Tax=Paraburkholderia caribensis TaxID=75105 RepID=UPI001CAE824C|nr:hypothetical protein [Paraburkholderia caribensis]CAG9251817.1 conserved hypothetical protein [Paraburkholderia caribensis]